MIGFIIFLIVLICLFLLVFSDSSKSSGSSGVSKAPKGHSTKSSVRFNFPGRAEIIGRRGENTVASYFPNSRYLIRNIYLKNAHGESVEIDMVYVTRRGVFVIECKNYKGYIFGGLENAQWTQTLNAGRYGIEKHHFYNPIWQNRTHVSAIRRYLGYDIPILPLVVFSSSDCEFKDVEDTDEEPVCHIFRLRKTLKRMYDIHPEVLSDEQKENIRMKLEARAHATSEERQHHIEEVKEKQNSHTICPKCGGHLVVRTNRRDGSHFYGCSNYPNCRYTRRMEE